MKIRKILPLFALSIALVGCGQKPAENPASDATETTTIEAPANEESTDQKVENKDDVENKDKVETESKDKVETESKENAESTEKEDATEAKDSKNN